MKQKQKRENAAVLEKWLLRSESKKGGGIEYILVNIL